MRFGPTPGYDDLRITTFSPRASGPAIANYTAVPVGYEIQAWSFANDGTMRGLNAGTQLHHGWLAGSDIFLHLHMGTTNALAEGADLGLFVVLLVQKQFQALADATVNTYWCHRIVPAGGYLAKTQVRTDGIAIPAALLDYSCVLSTCIFRHKGTGINTVNAGLVTEAVDDVLWLHEVDFHVKLHRYGTINPTGD